jgi:hypothetical protein
MTLDQITIAVAELDGIDITCWTDPDASAVIHYYPPAKPYTTSRDAIIPVIEKQLMTEETRDSDKLSRFWDYLNEQNDFFEEWGHCGMLIATPLQLCTALLKATGKWK